MSKTVSAGGTLSGKVTGCRALETVIVGWKGDRLDHRREKDWESVHCHQNAKGCSKTTIAGHGLCSGLLVLVQFVKLISERVEVRYVQDMERKEVSEGHSLWLGHRKK